MRPSVKCAAPSTPTPNAAPTSMQSKPRCWVASIPPLTPEKGMGSPDRLVEWPTRNAPTVRRLEVIEVAFLRGKGIDDTDPVRRVACFYDAETTELLWEADPVANRRSRLSCDEP